MIRTFAELNAAARAKGPRRVAIASAAEREVLLAAHDAQAQGLAVCTLVGKRENILRIAGEGQIDLTGMQIVDEHEPLTEGVG